MSVRIVILAVCDLVLCVLALLAIVVSPELRWAGIAGLGVAAIMAFALVLTARRTAPAAHSETDSRPDRAGAADFDEATSLRNQPTWRDDVEGRTGPKW
jgi:hypothetical protein